ncbi:unnamed protein product [Hermetia illucens]|uniref:Odorant receptor n=1 Tax=Hermetia illucens TaxID=343691 RepID=A0A7R8UTW2_HERIL|nr:unnamed protein product [Hermetia illucens]
MRVLTSVSALKQIRLIFRIMGLYPSKNHPRLYAIYSFVLFLIMGISSLSMILYLIFITTLEELIQSLPIQIIMILANWKSLTIRMNADKLSEIEDYLAYLDDKLLVPNRKDRMQNALKISRSIFYVFLVSYWVYLIIGAIGSYTNRKLPVESWFPFNITSSDEIFFMTWSYQNVVYALQVTRNMGCDAFCPIYLIILICQFNLFAAKVERIGTVIGKGPKNNLAELKEGFEIYEVLMRIFNHLDYIISRIMLTTFLITGVLLSCSVVQCLYFDLTPAEKAGLVMFFTGTPLELALCCYFADRFMVKTDQLVNVIYNMNWYEQGPEFRKMVIIFMEMNQNKKVILAGNLKEVNLAACMDIFKFTYTLIAFVLQMSG